MATNLNLKRRGAPGSVLPGLYVGKQESKSKSLSKSKTHGLGTRKLDVYRLAIGCVAWVFEHSETLNGAHSSVNGTRRGGSNLLRMSSDFSNCQGPLDTDIAGSFRGRVSRPFGINHYKWERPLGMVTPDAIP